MIVLKKTLTSWTSNRQILNCEVLVAKYLEDFRAVGVIFMFNHCPDVQLDEDRESLYCYLKLEAIAT